MGEGTPTVVPQRAPVLSAAFVPLLLLAFAIAFADLPTDLSNLVFLGIVAILGGVVVVCVLQTKRRARRPSLELLETGLRSFNEGGVTDLSLDEASHVLFDRGARWPMLMSGDRSFLGDADGLPTVYVFGGPYDDSYRERILGPGMTRLARWIEDPETPQRGRVLMAVEIQTLGPRGVDAAQRTVGDWCQEHGIAFEVRASGWWWRARRRLRATTPTSTA
jgi:hypothetical protein